MDVTAIESLIQLMRTHEVGELFYEDKDFKVKLRLGGMPVAVAPSAPVARAPEARPVEAPPAAPTGHLILSPMVGTFYRSSKPDVPPYCELGQQVRKGQALCIVEAMKLMNEIEADIDGKVVAVLVDNASPVQFGQPLFRILPG